MKLLELIVKNIKREKIDNDTVFVVQDGDGEIKLSNSNDIPILDGSNIWVRFSGIPGNVVGDGILNNADDWFTSVITMKELMRAYDLVEQGYTLWFGGDCPVPTGSFVDVIFGDGEIFSSYDAKAFSWRTVLEPNNIVAYRLKENDEDHEPITVNKDFDILGIVHIITHVMPCILAVDAIEIANSLIDEGYHK